MLDLIQGCKKWRFNWIRRTLQQYRQHAGLPSEHNTKFVDDEKECGKPGVCQGVTADTQPIIPESDWNRVRWDLAPDAVSGHDNANVQPGDGVLSPGRAGSLITDADLAGYSTNLLINGITIYLKRDEEDAVREAVIIDSRVPQKDIAGFDAQLTGLIGCPEEINSLEF